MSFISRVNRANKKLAHGAISNFMGDSAGRYGKKIANGLFNTTGGGLALTYGILPLISAPLSYDPTERSMGSHMARTMVESGAMMALDVGMESVLAPIMTGGKMWGLSTIRAGLASTGIGMALSLAGVGAGEIAGELMDAAGEAYSKAKGEGPAPITQNERTMKAMRQSMGLLGQATRGHNFLGSEAQYMHN